MIEKSNLKNGEKFFGCSKYPACKTTIPINSSVKNNEDESPRSVEFTVPRKIISREKRPGYQVEFYESVSFPSDVLSEILEAEFDPRLLRGLSQWRLDFPINRYYQQPDNKKSLLISVAEKILTRGRITFCSHLFEEKINEFFKKDYEHLTPEILESVAYCSFRKEGCSFYFDSEEEKLFYINHLPSLLGPNFCQFVTPQISLSTLLSTKYQDHRTEDLSKRRVDFCIFYPALDEGIIIEIDGKQHKDNKTYDQQRDSILKKEGYNILRIPANSIRNSNRNIYEQLNPIYKQIQESKQQYHSKCQSRYLQIFKLSHQIQLAVLNAIAAGFIDLSDEKTWNIIIDLDEIGLFNIKEAKTIAEESVSDLFNLIKNIALIYGIDLPETKPNVYISSEINEFPKDYKGIFITFTNTDNLDIPTFYVQNAYFNFNISNIPFPAQPPVEPLKCTESILLYFLRYIFRKESFWEGQFDGICRILSLKDTILLLPTGAGKSLVYQLSSFLLPGITIIIDPIISLMEDQIYNLSRYGIDRCISISSHIKNPEDRNIAINLVSHSEYMFVFVAPERFQTQDFREALRGLTVSTPVSLIVIDEAHCVSEWGHDFRTSYLNIGRTSRLYCKSQDFIPPLVALTGTASRSVLKDILRELKIDDFEAIITPKSFDRKELKFHVISASSQDKYSVLANYISIKLPSLFGITFSTLFQTRGNDTYSGLIFCPHIDSDFGIVKVSEYIKEKLNIHNEIYSGQIPKRLSHLNYQVHKSRVTLKFKKNQVPVLVCTKAFGMGIDKPNIRYTVHFNLPQSLESFYQEAGRAGRDRNTAHCCIIYSNDNKTRAQYLLDPKTPIEEIINELDKSKANRTEDDITRMLYFHTQSFRGINKDLEDIKAVLGYFHSFDRQTVLDIPYKDGDRDENNFSANSLPLKRNRLEKAIHRLLLIGVVSDYTIDYQHHKIRVNFAAPTKENILYSYDNFVGTYLYSRRFIELEKAKRHINLPIKDFIVEISNQLLHFIYEVIEKSRRRALLEMMLACDEARDDNRFRSRLINYLEETEYSAQLEEIIRDSGLGLTKAGDIIKSISSVNDAAEVRGQVSRYLESYPDHPTLLMIRAISEAFCKNADHSVVESNFTASLLAAKMDYQSYFINLIDFSVLMINDIFRKSFDLSVNLVHAFLNEFPEREIYRYIIQKLSDKLDEIPAWYLINKLSKDCINLTKRGGKYAKGSISFSRGSSQSAEGSSR